MRNQKVVTTFWFLLASTPALAHHGASDRFMHHMQPMTRVRAEVEGAGFELAGETGNYVTKALRGDYALSPDFGIGARIPFHTLWVKGSGRSSGIGDLDLVALFRVLDGDGLAVSAGLTIELPTGDEEKGIGSGHAELSPFVAAGADAGPFMLHGAFGVSLSLAHDHHEPGEPDGSAFNFTGPHASRELQYHVGAIRKLTDAIFVNATLSGFTPFEKTEGVGHVITAGADLGWMIDEALRLTLGAQAPIAGTARFDWKTGLTLDLLF